ncbi:winged helix DNA-binding domain-containing protein [Methanocella sp. MCL-LM]|uniref:winged helix DNA-binding domain-containing protein n=1 Tax=Methanocella sp. MCL-LM TaxID=3412035 RepID=UPI003C78AB63
MTRRAPTSDLLSVTRDQALAFRLAGHNLSRRLPPGSLLKAAGTCGIQNSPPGSAALSLHARVDGFSPGDLDRALAVDKTLLQMMSLRGAPYIFPTADAGAFTAGLLPDDEESLCFFIQGVGQALDRIGISVTGVVSLASAALYEVLDGREMTKDQMGVEVAELLLDRLTQEQQQAWQSESWYAPGQSLGESVVRFAFYAISLQGLFCYAPRHDDVATFLRTDRWLGAPLPEADRALVAADLVRRYLHCYGPSTAGHYAEWAGISPAQAAGTWKLVERELTEVVFEGRRAWLLSTDIPLLAKPPASEGVRLLPPHDPYLQLRDRATLVPDKKMQRDIWRPTGNPGAVIADGQFAGTWRSRKKGKQLALTVELIESLSPGAVEEIEAEAAAIARFKSCAMASVELARRA